MARRRTQVSQYRGRYFRNLGKVVNARGEVAPKKFLLGTDARAAEVANRRLEELWALVVREHEHAVRWMSEIGGRLAIPDQVRGRRRRELRNLDLGPIWLPETLDVAEVIRNGRHEVPVEIGDSTCPMEYVGRIAHLREELSVIAFVPASPEFYAQGQVMLRAQADGHLDEARQFAHLASAPIPEAAGPGLYEALDAYGDFARSRNAKEFGLREAAAAGRLKDSHPDVPLSQFGISTLERIAAYWSSRPKAKKTGRAIALSTVKNQLKTARRFVRWLHRTDRFEWSRSVEAEEALRVDVERLRTDNEIASLRNGVQIWTVDELVTLYRYATDQERLLMLLGLNAGFAQAEICSLLHEEIEREKTRAVIRRIRRKNRVYGEFVLWPDTVRAVDWFLGQQAGAKRSESTCLLVTQRGKPFDRQRIANIWNRLLDRVQQDLPEFRRLSFKYLRKTAGQLVRDQSDGEIAGVFLCHGQAVRSDELADRYTNRPFAKVAEALAGVHTVLNPMFDNAPHAFMASRTGGSPNITLKMIDDIQALRARGVSATAVAKLLHVSRATVHRWSDGAGDTGDDAPAGSMNERLRT